MCSPFHEEQALNALRQIPPCQSSKAATVLLGATGDMVLNQLSQDGELLPAEERDTNYVANRTDLLFVLTSIPDADQLDTTGGRLAETSETHRALREGIGDNPRYDRPQILTDLLRLTALALTQEQGETRTVAELLRDEASVLTLAGWDTDEFVADLAAAEAKMRLPAGQDPIVFDDVVKVERVVVRGLVRGDNYSETVRASHMPTERGGTGEASADDLAVEAMRRIANGEDPFSVLNELGGRLIVETLEELGLEKPEGEDGLDLDAMLRELDELPETDERH